jgi:RimJ/RimL family protein N-acetyltransferase
MTVTLRKLAVSDVALILRWRNENAAFFGDGHLMTPGEHREWFGACMADPWDHMYVVLADGRPAGTIGVAVSGGRAEIRRVLLGDKSLARSGVMSAALDAVMNAYGPRIWELRVLASNVVAAGFYGKNGFRETARDAGWVVMTR